MANAIVMTIEGVRTRASTNEALVTFAVPLEQAALVSGFMSKIGRQVGAAFADVESGEIPAAAPAAADEKIYGYEARTLRLSGFCRCPAVWKALGTDEEFRAWIQKQPSAWSGEFSTYVDGEGRCEAAHVSRIEYGRGIGHKPEYACIPLTHKEHALQHAKGESVFSQTDKRGVLIGGREFFEKMRMKYVEQWAWETLRATLGYDSMGEAEPSVVRAWAVAHGVADLLPGKYPEGLDAADVANVTQD
jgi:hypothetical protein